MPVVNGKHYSYTKAGYKAAARAAALKRRAAPSPKVAKPPKVRPAMQRMQGGM